MPRGLSLTRTRLCSLTRLLNLCVAPSHQESLIQLEFICLESLFALLMGRHTDGFGLLQIEAGALFIVGLALSFCNSGFSAPTGKEGNSLWLMDLESEGKVVPSKVLIFVFISLLYFTFDRSWLSPLIIRLCQQQ